MRKTVLFLSLLLATPTLALTVDSDGSISCKPGLEPVYWQEDDGMDPKYRDVVVVDYERFNGVLVYQEHANRSMVLDNQTAGTNINWRWLAMPDGESYGTIRGLPVDTSLLPEGSSEEYSGKSVHVLIIGPRFFWPVCARSSSVEKWFKDAELPESHKFLD